MFCFHPIARVALRLLAWFSALAALSLLCLPLLLALLMLLFDSTAQGLLVLIGAVARWLGSFLPAGGALQPYRSLPLDPGVLALASFLRMTPCLVGLATTLAAPARRAAWALAAACWIAALPLIDRAPMLALSPGIVAALLLAIDAGRRPAA